MVSKVWFTVGIVLGPRRNSANLNKATDRKWMGHDQRHSRHDQEAHSNCDQMASLDGVGRHRHRHRHLGVR